MAPSSRISFLGTAAVDGVPGKKKYLADQIAFYLFIYLFFFFIFVLLPGIIIQDRNRRTLLLPC